MSDVESNPQQGPSGPVTGKRLLPRAATRVAGGILSSRVMGLVRESTLAYFFGAGGHADVFRTALRAPNLLQNLLGEQTLSASFIPIYSRLLEEGREEDAGRFAGAIFGLLLCVSAAVSLVGVLFAGPIVSLFAPGYLADAGKVAAGTATVDRFGLAVQAVRWIFPMTGLLVLSAWALGVLNSHRRFFLPYFAPVLWNAAIIAGLWMGGVTAGSGPGVAGDLLLPRNAILMSACVGALVGGAAQFLVQVPLVARVMRGFRLSLSLRVQGVRQALAAFAPLTAGRGAVQLSSYLDQLLASFLAAGAVAALGWAAVLYLLPVSLFGMSVAAAELPELSRRAGDESGNQLADRVHAGLKQMYFLAVPTFIGYLAFGFLIVGGLYRRGNFRLDDNWLVYLVLAGYSIGLLATMTSRLLNNVFFALGKTGIPARIAIERVALSAVAGCGLMVVFDRVSVTGLVGMTGGERDLRLGALGLALAAGFASWYELFRLLGQVQTVTTGIRIPLRRVARMLGAALVSAVPASAVWLLVPDLPLMVQAAVVIGVYAGTYLVTASGLGVSEVASWLGRRS